MGWEWPLTVNGEECYGEHYKETIWEDEDTVQWECWNCGDIGWEPR